MMGGLNKKRTHIKYKLSDEYVTNKKINETLIKFVKLQEEVRVKEQIESDGKAK